MANFLQEFIPDYVSTTSLLYELIKGKRRPNDILDWTKKHETTFTELKQRLYSATALGLPNSNKPFHV